MIDILTLREYVGTTEADKLLEAFEKSAVAYVEGRTGRYFGPPEVVTEVLRGSNGQRLWLGDTPIAGEAIAVVQAYGPGDDGEELVVDGDLGFVVRGDALVRRVGVWNPRYEYRVTYTRGYADGNEPEDIKLYVLQHVKREWDSRSTGGMQSEQIAGVYSYTVSKNATGADDALFARWIRPVVA
jgi:hypothetical protein